MKVMAVEYGGDISDTGRSGKRVDCVLEAAPAHVIIVGLGGTGLVLGGFVVVLGFMVVLGLVVAWVIGLGVTPADEGLPIISSPSPPNLFSTIGLGGVDSVGPGVGVVAGTDCGTRGGANGDDVGSALPDPGIVL